MLMTLAEEKDFEEIVALANWSYRGRDDAEQSWNIESGIIEGQRLTLDLLHEETEAKCGGALLCFRDTADGPLVGTIWAHPLSAATWHLSLLSVRPDRQAEGLGRKFFQAGEEYARERGAKRMHITVLAVRDVLLGWYGRLGYVATGETEPFPYDDPRFGKPLREDLHFIVMERDL